MVPTPYIGTAPVPPPAYQRAVARRGPDLHISAVALVRVPTEGGWFHLLALCEFAVTLAQRRCPPALPKGPGGAPIVDPEASLLLIALLRTLWRLSDQDMHDWLVAWPALAAACGLPRDATGQLRVPCASQQWKRLARADAEGGRGAALRTALRRYGPGGDPPSGHQRSRSDHRQRAHQGLAQGRSGCGGWSRSRAASHPLLARLPGAYAALPGFRSARPVLALAGQCPRRPLRPTLADAGRPALCPATPRGAP